MERVKREIPNEGRILATNVRSYPAEFLAVGGVHRVEVGVVLVAGGIGDYAAYIGVGSAEFIARHGDKLPFEEAVTHFPIGLEKEKYRV